ncbi:MAG: hypothetical protein [Circular genetic element sp.]|nr:MAG: hypothetical protein [Circular genetic element sp.]
MEYHIPIYGQYRFAADLMDPQVNISNEEVIYHSMMSAYVPIAMDLTLYGGTAKHYAAYRHVGKVKYLASPGIFAMGLFGLLAQQNFALIRRAPSHARKGMWQMFSSALSGSSWNLGSAIDL